MGSFVKKAQYLFVDGGQIERGNVLRVPKHYESKAI
jgi:hypothetical protein